MLFVTEGDTLKPLTVRFSEAVPLVEPVLVFVVVAARDSMKVHDAERESDCVSLNVGELFKESCDVTDFDSVDLKLTVWVPRDRTSVSVLLIDIVGCSDWEEATVTVCDTVMQIVSLCVSDVVTDE